jgi:hypothetical protein
MRDHINHTAQLLISVAVDERATPVGQRTG